MSKSFFCLELLTFGVTIVEPVWMWNLIWNGCDINLNAIISSKHGRSVGTSGQQIRKPHAKQKKVHNFNKSIKPAEATTNKTANAMELTNSMGLMTAHDHSEQNHTIHDQSQPNCTRGKNLKIYIKQLGTSQTFIIRFINLGQWSSSTQQLNNNFENTAKDKLSWCII